jgi:Phospholipase_D-nuclease N-terminal
MLAIVAPAVSLGASALSGKAWFALAPLFVLLGALIVYCLVDLIRAPSVRYLPKLVWALIIVVVSAPLGALAYLVFGKDRHDHDINGHDISEPAGHVAARR